MAPVVAGFGTFDDGEEGVSEHGKQGPAMPGQPAADLMLIEPGQVVDRKYPVKMVERATGIEPAWPACKAASDAPSEASIAGEAGSQIPAVDRG